MLKTVGEYMEEVERLLKSHADGNVLLDYFRDKPNVAVAFIERRNLQITKIMIETEMVSITMARLVSEAREKK